jgi:hypothetical protein
MIHSLNKETSQLLCDAMRCREEDGNASAEKWTDSSGRALAPDRFWNTTMESMIASDDSLAGPCLGIELSIWGRAKVGIHFNYIVYTVYIKYIVYTFIAIITIICIVGTSAYCAQFGGGWRPAWWSRCP